MNELRKHYLLDEWVIIAAERAKRPTDFQDHSEKEEEEGKCFFCPGNEDTTPPEIHRIEGEDGEWKIRAFPNKFPATTEHYEPLEERSYLQSAPAYGNHEVIVETPVHGQELGDLSVDHIADLLKMYQHRISDLKKDARIQYVSVFKNKGDVAGASLQHSHTQLVALSMTPPLVRRELYQLKRNQSEYRACSMCQIIREELETERKIYENQDFGVIAPFASKYPFTTWVVPKQHFPSLEQLNEEQTQMMADAVKKPLNSLNQALDYPPYNMHLHIAPNTGEDEEYHFYLGLFPRVQTWAGFELSTSVIINTVPPEQAAEHLKQEM